MSQVNFASQFKGLLDLHNNTRGLKSAPVAFSFAPHKNPYVEQPKDTEMGGGIDLVLNVSIKCLKPKLIFTLCLETTSTSLLHSLKSAILKAIEERGYIVKESDMKLLFKTKHIQDSTSMNQLVDLIGSTDIPLNVMIKTFQETSTSNEEEGMEQEQQPVVIKESTWKLIEQALSQDLPSDLVSTTLWKFKSIV